MVSKKVLFLTTTLLLVLSSFTSLALGQTRVPKPTEEVVRAQNAAGVLGEIMDAPDQRIPRTLLDSAYGIAVFPRVFKGAFGFGGRFGKGLIAQRNADGGWGSPLFVQISGGGVGLQLGVEATDVIMVFTNREGVNSLLRGKLKIGADASATAGPVGRRTQAPLHLGASNALMQREGAALEGAM